MSPRHKLTPTLEPAPAPLLGADRIQLPRLLFSKELATVWSRILRWIKHLVPVLDMGLDAVTVAGTI